MPKKEITKKEFLPISYFSGFGYENAMMGFVLKKLGQFLP